MMAISLGEGIGLTATEVINENDQVVAIPLKEVITMQIMQ